MKRFCKGAISSQPWLRFGFYIIVGFYLASLPESIWVGQGPSQINNNSSSSSWKKAKQRWTQLILGRSCGNPGTTGKTGKLKTVPEDKPLLCCCLYNQERCPCWAGYPFNNRGMLFFNKLGQCREGRSEGLEIIAREKASDNRKCQVSPLFRSARSG